MKRPKHKRFKRRIDLIRYAVKRAIHRIDILESETHAKGLTEHLKKTDWLRWARRKLEKTR